MKAALLALALAAAPADSSALFALYAQGHYHDAMRRGEDSHTAEGLAIAARAALADAMTRPEPCLSCLQRAEEDARRAIALDGRLADCHVWLATSLGYEARIQGVMRASWSNSPAQAKEQLDAALAIDPANAYALAALGGWHVEIVRVGGAFLASKVYDASLEKSLALFDRAGRAAPHNVAVHYQIALSLAGLDEVAYRQRIESELQTAIQGPPQTAYEKFVAARAQELLNLMKRGDGDAFDARLRTFQGYP
jgi:tetratricopeptide (TPR) repeat protein